MELPQVIWLHNRHRADQFRAGGLVRLHLQVEPRFPDMILRTLLNHLAIHCIIPVGRVDRHAEWSRKSYLGLTRNDL